MISMRCWKGALHRVTHGCVHMDKPGVGEIWLCRRRLGRSFHVHIRPTGDEIWTLLTVASDVAAAETPDELRAAIAAAGRMI